MANFGNTSNVASVVEPSDWSGKCSMHKQVGMTALTLADREEGFELPG